MQAGFTIRAANYIMHSYTKSPFRFRKGLSYVILSLFLRLVNHFTVICITPSVISSSCFGLCGAGFVSIALNSK